MELWLPIRSQLRPVREERDLLLNRLVELRVLVPGAKDLELSELRDLVQWQEERKADDIKKALWRPAYRPKKLSRQQVVIGLREYYHEFVIPRREGRKRLYAGVTVEGEATG